MSEFECNLKTNSTVMLLFLDREKIFLSPPYQRASGIWNLDKKQLLIDSLINGFDIPKLYLHEYERPEKHNGKLYKFAIVDGKQRLLAIWDFMLGKYNLADDFEYLTDKKLVLGGLSYDQLTTKYPSIHAAFTGRPISAISIRTSDTELIEEMFSRLNEAVALNAAEKRNALGGPVPPLIRSLVQSHQFFTDRLSISNSRYQHHDLACKLMYLEQRGKPAETKKSTLDEFVLELRKNQSKKDASKEAKLLKTKVVAGLKRMTGVFKHKDSLLKSPAIVVVYYLMFNGLYENAVDYKKIKRGLLHDFQQLIIENRKIAESDIKKADPEITEFDTLRQSPNDASALEYRLKILSAYIQKRTGGNGHSKP